MPNLTNFNKFDYSGDFFNKLLGFLLIIIAIFVSGYTSTVIWIQKRSIMEKLTYKPITEQVAEERAYTLKTSIATELQVVSDSGRTKITVPAGTTVKVLGVSMINLSFRAGINYNRAPWVYSPDQQFFIELPDGTRGAARLPEAFVGRKIIVKSGDLAGQTLTVTGVKENKTKDQFPYDFSVEGSKNTYKWGEFTCVNKDTPDMEMVVYNSPLAGVPEAERHKAAHVPPFMKIPTHDDNGFFLFPRYKKWNMYKIMPWWRGRIMLTVYWLILMVIVVKLLDRKSINLSVDAKFDYLENPAYSNEEVYMKAVRYYWPRYYIRAFIVGCVFSPVVWLFTKINRSSMISSLRQELNSERCPKCAQLELDWKYTGNETPWTYLKTVHTEQKTYIDRKNIEGEKVYDRDKKEVRDRQMITSTTFAAGSYDLYERKKEYVVYCKHCQAILEKDWEEEHESRNHQGGEVLRERSWKESVTRV